MIVVEVSGCPIGKARPRFSRRTGHAYTPQKTRSYEAALRYAAQQVMGDAAPITGPVIVMIEAYMPIPKSWSKGKRAAALANTTRPTGRPDADNLMKGTADALNEIVFKDDAQIVDGRVVKRYSDRPRLRVEVQEMLG